MTLGLRPSNDLLPLLFVFSKAEAACTRKYSRIDPVGSAVDSKIWIYSDLLEEESSEKSLFFSLRPISWDTNAHGKTPTLIVNFGSWAKGGWWIFWAVSHSVLKGIDNLSEVINKYHYVPWSVRLFKKKLSGEDSSPGCNIEHIQLIFSAGGCDDGGLPPECSQ